MLTLQSLEDLDIGRSGLKAGYRQCSVPLKEGVGAEKGRIAWGQEISEFGRDVIFNV
jgi:hypothetical protein